jgi:hypothetical protein
MNYYKFIKEGFPEIILEITNINDENTDQTTCGSVYSALFEYTLKSFKDGSLEAQKIEKIMNIIENTLNHGSQNLQEAATIIFLEDLTNKNFSDLYNYSKKYIGEKSKIQISEINKFWKNEA